MTEDRRRRELEDAILANRDDAEAYLVLADYLEGIGDPLGILISLELRAELEPRNNGLRFEIKEHLRRYKALSPEIDIWRTRLRWRRGLVDGIKLENPRPDTLTTLLEHPTCQLVASLSLDLTRDAVGILDRVFQSRPTLEELKVHFTTGGGAVAADWLETRVPNLAVATLRGHRLIDPLSHTRLRKLILWDYWAREQQWNLPALEELHSTASGIPVSDLDELPALRRVHLDQRITAEQFDSPAFRALAERLEYLHVRSSDEIDTADALLRHATQYERVGVLSIQRERVIRQPDPDAEIRKARWRDVGARLSNLRDEAQVGRVLPR